MSGIFIPLRIKEIRQETPEAVSLLFEYPEDRQEKLHFKPGQYLTVKWTDGGKELRRSYSISSVPDDPYLAITIKEVRGGKISPLLCRKLKPGDTLEILPPEGRFTADFGPDQKRNIYLIGAGSGITPLISIARFVLEKEPRSAVIMLYGSRSEDKIIFREELDRLTTIYANQLFVYYTLSRPEGGGPGLIKSLFGRKKPEWTGLRGRIDAARIKEILQRHPLTRKNDLFFLCGPGDFIVMTEKNLLAEGIPEEQIKKEYFTPATDPGHVPADRDKKAGGTSSQVTVHMRGETISLEVTDKTILDTLLDKGYDAPYSCHSGACATCMAKIISGRVEMDACFALSDKEVEAGYVLACQSRPVTDEVEITFDA